MELSWLIMDIVLTFGHQIYAKAPIGFVSQYAKIILQIKYLLRSSLPEEELGEAHMSFLAACKVSQKFPLKGHSSTWDMGVFKNFLVANFGALKRYFTAITTACSTGPTFGVCVFVTSRASRFRYRSEAGFARATSSFTKGLGPLIFLTPPYRDGVGACFQMAACETGGMIDCEEYLRTQASLWSIADPGVAKVSHKQAFREQKVASIVLPTERKVGASLFATPSLAAAWMLKATWQKESTISYRDLTYECRGQGPFFSSQTYWGTVSTAGSGTHPGASVQCSILRALSGAGK